MISSLPTLSVAVLLSMLALSSVSCAAADEPPAASSVAAAAGKTDVAADAAVKRGSAPAAIAARVAERVHCREQAAKRKLFGLGRHKFLQRCRRARRKAVQTPPAPPPRQNP